MKPHARQTAHRGAERDKVLSGSCAHTHTHTTYSAHTQTLADNTYAHLLCCSCDYLPKLDKYKCVKRKSLENRLLPLGTNSLWSLDSIATAAVNLKLAFLINGQTL